MRDKWYSDNRDLVKWGVLLQLAELYNTATILQVAYYRPTPWDGIEIDGRAYPLPLEVVNHFRNIKNIATLRPNVMVLDAPCHDRAQYLQCILMAIQKLPKEPAIVFLDPDIGLEPRGKAGLEHVLETELREIWHALRSGDLLAFYQHQTNMAGRPWVKEKQTQFEKAIGLEPGVSKLACGKEIARDVAFFFSHRLDSAETVQAAR
jgi:hypothetical protein